MNGGVKHGGGRQLSGCECPSVSISTSVSYPATVGESAGSRVSSWSEGERRATGSAQSIRRGWMARAGRGGTLERRLATNERRMKNGRSRVEEGKVTKAKPPPGRKASKARLGSRNVCGGMARYSR